MGKILTVSERVHRPYVDELVRRVVMSDARRMDQVKRILRIATFMRILVTFVALPGLAGACVYFLDPASDWQLFLYAVALLVGIGLAGFGCAWVDLWAEDRIKSVEILGRRQLDDPKRR